MATKKITLLFCVNERSGNRASCAQHQANALRKYAKGLAEAREGTGAMPIKVKKSGCLGYCSRGPVIEVLPEKAFYRYESEQDIDAVVARHIDGGKKLKRLLIAKKKA